MVEQLPHCDLLRLILLTERFVLSARRVFHGSKGIGFFFLLFLSPQWHCSVSRPLPFFPTSQSMSLLSFAALAVFPHLVHRCHCSVAKNRPAQSRIFISAASPDGIAQRSFETAAKRAYDTAYSQAVTHPSTNAAQSCLTSVIGRELVFSTWYGRRHDLELSS